MPPPRPPASSRTPTTKSRAGESPATPPVSRLNPPHPLIHHPRRARRVLLLLPPGRPNPASAPPSTHHPAAGEQSTRRIAAKPPTLYPPRSHPTPCFLACDHPTTHQPHHRCARLTPAGKPRNRRAPLTLQLSDFPTNRQAGKPTSRKVGTHHHHPPAGERPSTIHTSSHRSGTPARSPPYPAGRPNAAKRPAVPPQPLPTPCFLACDRPPHSIYTNHRPVLTRCRNAAKTPHPAPNRRP